MRYAKKTTSNGVWAESICPELVYLRKIAVEMLIKMCNVYGPLLLKTKETYPLLSKLLSSKEYRKIQKELYDCFILQDEKKKNGGVSSSRVAQNYLKDNYYFSDKIIEKGICAANERMEPIIQNLLKTLDNNHKSLNELPSVKNAHKRYLNVQEMFKFNDKEMEILQFYMLSEMLSEFNDVTSSLMLVKKHGTAMRNLGLLLDISTIDLEKLLGKKSKLIAGGFLDVDDYAHRFTINGVGHQLQSYLLGTIQENFCDTYFQRVDTSQAIELCHFSAISLEEKNALLKMLATDNHKSNILLYGTPGTGKTEFAKSIAATLKKEAYFITVDDDNSIETRRQALVAAVSSLNINESIIVVDECDQLINTIMSKLIFGEATDKAWLNLFLETSQAKIIWIANSLGQVEDSVLRRFSFSLKFKELNNYQRRIIWNKQLAQNKCKIFLDDEIDRLSKKYAVSAGAISLCVQDIISTSGHDKNKNELLTEIDVVLNNHYKLLHPKGRSTDILKPVDYYKLECLNIDQDKQHIVENLKRFVNRDITCSIKNMNLLLFGPPGTGKTEFVKFICDHIGKSLIIKRASDLLGMYVGESEKTIKRAFEEAEENNSCLFIDEADSFFINRENASKSWEVSLTNELLCQMENFNGILLCATNHKESLDSAAIRRFNYKVKFDYLTPDALVMLYHTMLAELVDEKITDQEKVALQKISNLTPGDFKVVYQKNALIVEKKSHAKLIEDLKREVLLKNETKRRIGLS